MITKASEIEKIQEWIGAVKAAEIIGCNRITVFKNAMAGRFPLRVREGRQLFFLPAIEKFEGAPMGNPNLTQQEKGLRRTDTEFRDYRQKIEATYSDAVYEIEYKNGGFYANTVVFDKGEYRQLPPKLLRKG